MANKRKACKIAGLKYPASDKIKNRTSTLARAMACTIDPRKPCSKEDEVNWLYALGQEEGHLTCVYCGAVATHLDHLFPLIEDKKPTGSITEPGNLVPCCKDCNQKKGNKNWDVFMSSSECSHVDRLIDERKNRIRALVEKFNPTNNNWQNNSDFMDNWDNAYRNCCNALEEAQELLEKYRNNK